MEKIIKSKFNESETQWKWKVNTRAVCLKRPINEKGNRYKTTEVENDAIITENNIKVNEQILFCGRKHTVLIFVNLLGFINLEWPGNSLLYWQCF